jgi:hypothetical protein
MSSAKKRVVAEVVKESKKDLPDNEERKIVVAKRRWNNKENEDDTEKEDPEKRGKFQLKGSFDIAAVTSNRPAFDFAKAIQNFPKKQPEEVKAIQAATSIQADLEKEQKIFVNKNLFCNPTIRPLPSITKRQSEAEKPTPKVEDERPEFVKENFLSSSKALKFKDEVNKPPRNDSPIVKSLFDFKGNEIYKEEEKKVSPAAEKPSNPFKSAQPV